MDLAMLVRYCRREYYKNVAIESVMKYVTSAAAFQLIVQINVKSVVHELTRMIM